MVGWFVGWLVGWLVASLVGWLVVSRVKEGVPHRNSVQTLVTG